ncbi:MAG: hypothetical protein H0X02_03955 [Nitrosomonas sp.]|jgi:hypothetical protein|nr:hypothetical protein [Nitrosomonas sp.]
MPRLPNALIKYLDPKLPADAFCISGINILFQAADPALQGLMEMHWGSFRVSISEVKKAQAVFQISDCLSSSLPSLRKSHHFRNEHFLFLSDGKRYLLTGYFYDHPWQFHCRSLPGCDPEFIYYYLLEPILLDLLKKLGLLVWHSAAVAIDGMAVLLPGVSGSGKSTTTLNFLKIGYRFLADDVVLLRTRGRAMEAMGHESGLYLTEKSLRLLPEWKKFKRGRRCKKGRRWKYLIDLTSFRQKHRSKPPQVKFLLFPQVTNGTETRLERLTKAQALLECLRQSPKEYPASILGPSVLQSQFEIYSILVRSARCYKIQLGSEQEQVRTILSRLKKQL